MILCTSCNFENDQSRNKCVNCGELLLCYNSFSGMPELNGTSCGQVLQMRFVVEEKLAEDKTGVTYFAEDAMTGKTIFLRLLPTTLKLDNEQVQNLKADILKDREPTENILCSVESFEKTGKANYFVYSKQKLQADGDQIINFIKNDADGRIKSIDKDSYMAPALPPENEKEIKALKEEKENLVALAKQHENELERLKSEFEEFKKNQARELEQAKELLSSQVQKKIETEKKCELLENTINSLQNEKAGEQEKYCSLISELEDKFKNISQEKQKAESELSSQKESINNLQEKLREYEEKHTSEIAGYKKSIKELIETNKESHNSIRQKDSRLNQLTSELEETRKTKVLSASEVASQKEVINRLEAKLKNLQEKYSEQICEHKKAVENFKRENENVYTALNDKDSQLEQLSAAFKRFEQKAESDIDEYRQKIANEIDSRECIEKKYEYLKVNFEQYSSEALKKENILKSKISELELKVDELTKKTENNQVDQSSNDKIISKLKEQLIDQQEKHSAELSKAAWKNKTVTKNLAKADEKIQSLLKSNTAGEPNSPQADHAQLEKANWKIKALKDEVEKLNSLYEEKTKTGIQPAGKPAKFFRLALPLSLITGLACGIGATYYHLNPKIKSSVINQPVSKSVEKNQISEPPVNTNVSKLTKKKSEAVENKKLGQNNSEIVTASKTLETENKQPEPLQTIEKLVDAAQTGDTDAVFNLGLAYYQGYGVEKDYKKALELFIKAAEGGKATAMYNAGMMFQQGTGTDPNETEAVNWYIKASNRGLPKAMNQLGQMFYFGQAVEENHEIAAKYYEQSALAGNTKAMYNIACLYQTGDGVEKDITKAMKWWVMAARQGDTDSMIRLGEMFEGKYSIKKDLSKAHHWYQRAANAGDDTAKQKLIKLEVSD